MTSPSQPITFYDIASAAPLHTFAPNPWKTRYALNHKRLPYTTKWISMPDISALREELRVPANRTLPNGKPYHTLPVLQDPSTNTLLGDSFEIALYLDRAYPDAPTLFTPGTIGLTAALNSQVDGLFTKHVTLSNQMPFDPSVASQIQEIFATRMAGTAVAEHTMEMFTPEGREKLFVSFENALGEFVKAYYHVGGTTDYFWSKTGTAEGQSQVRGRVGGGCFLDGEEPRYADFIVGAWLAAAEAGMNGEDWARVRGFQGGFWGRLHDALAPLREMK